MLEHAISRRRFVRAVGAGGLAVSATGFAEARGPPTNFRAHLAGDNEVPEVETDATRHAVFQLSEDGMELRYKLIVANIEGVTQAHIYLGLPDDYGPVVPSLFGFVEGGVTTNGVLEEGVITASDLVGQLAGEEMDDLVEEIGNNNAYVNVHTVLNPAGEIRGQIP